MEIARTQSASPPAGPGLLSLARNDAAGYNQDALEALIATLGSKTAPEGSNSYASIVSNVGSASHDYPNHSVSWQSQVYNSLHDTHTRSQIVFEMNKVFYGKFQFPYLETPGPAPRTRSNRTITQKGRVHTESIRGVLYSFGSIDPID